MSRIISKILETTLIKSSRKGSPLFLPDSRFIITINKKKGSSSRLLFRINKKEMRAINKAPHSRTRIVENREKVILFSRIMGSITKSSSPDTANSSFTEAGILCSKESPEW